MISCDELPALVKMENWIYSGECIELSRERNNPQRC
jgi:hypothetical protein